MRASLAQRSHGAAGAVRDCAAREVRGIKDLPKTATGKIQRFRLRERHERQMKWWADNGFVKSALPMNKVVDMSVLEEAIKQLGQ